MFQAAIHLYTPDNDYVVGAMVTHQVGSVGRAAVLHLLPETLISNLKKNSSLILLLWYLAGKMQRKKKQMWQLSYILYTFLTFQEPQFVLML